MGHRLQARVERDAVAVTRIRGDAAVGGFAMHSVHVSVSMGVSVLAIPPVIDFGGASDLSVNVQGGVWPYSYEWTPADGLNPIDLNNPFPNVRPTASVTYQMTVTDANGDVGIGSVYLHVNEPGPVNACFTVNPDPPDMGGAVEQWDASCSFGEGTLQYRWVFSCPYETPCTVAFGANAVINADGSVTLIVEDTSTGLRDGYTILFNIF